MRQVFALLGSLAVAASLSGPRAQERQVEPDVFFAPTPQAVVDAMLRLADVTARDIVYDLGSGDGRIPITAARVYGARGVGIDIDPELTAEATRRARQAGVSDRVRFLTADLFTSDISDATVVTLYLKPTLNTKLLPRLNAELAPGTRIVSHRWEMKDALGSEFAPQRRLLVEGSNVFLWTAPIR